MDRWSRYVTGVNGVGFVYAFGGLYAALAIREVALGVTTGGALVATAIDVLLVGAPGVALLYGGYWLRNAKIHRETYWRVGGWTVVGFLVMVGVVGLVDVEPGVTIDNPLWAYTLGSAIGTVGGFVVGVNDARAVTQAREVERHNWTLEHRNDRLESFASMLAHEVRNPLSIAKLYLPQATDGDDASAEKVEAALDRIEEMIDVLLVTARGTDADIDPEPVELSTAAEAAWEDLSTATARLDVTADGTVLTDPVHLRHLLENLFRNSVEHGSTDSRSEGEDSTDCVTIRVGDLEDGFYVEDDGPGIPADEREAVFEAGYTTETNGIGLGLTFVSQLVETYGWTCTITDSEYESPGGARFEFRGVDLVSAEPQPMR